MKVGFIGLGNMGGPMALNVRKAGFELVVHDTRPQQADPHRAQGATWAGSPREVAQDVDVVCTSLPGPAEVDAVALGPNGVLEGARPGTVYVDLSTGSPTRMRSLHARFKERQVHVLDAPVSGGVWGAQAGTLQIMVGGDTAIFERVRPVLRAMGDKVSHMGDIGAGSIAKLVHNMIGICAVELYAEAFTLGVKAGVRPEALLEAVQGGAYGQGMLLRRMLPEICFQADYENVRFALALARKDLGLATQLAREFDVPMAIAAVAEQGMVEAMARGWGGKDSAIPFALQEERARVQVRTAK